MFLKSHIIAIFLGVAFTLGTASWSVASAPQNDELQAQFDYVAQVLEGKLVRHFEIRDYLGPLFQDQDGRDRFLLNFVALVRRGGILDTTVRRVSWNVGEIDEVYGFATSELTACGRWYLWIPRCVAVETQWRRVEGQWYLLPPPQIRLDPEVKKFLRRI